MRCYRVKELEASAALLDNKPADGIPLPAADDTPLRKQSSDLAAIRTTNVSDFASSSVIAHPSQRNCIILCPSVRLSHLYGLCSSTEVIQSSKWE